MPGCCSFRAVCKAAFATASGRSFACRAPALMKLIQQEPRLIANGGIGCEVFRADQCWFGEATQLSQNLGRLRFVRHFLLHLNRRVGLPCEGVMRVSVAARYDRTQRVLVNAGGQSRRADLWPQMACRNQGDSPPIELRVLNGSPLVPIKVGLHRRDRRIELGEQSFREDVLGEPCAGRPRVPATAKNPQADGMRLTNVSAL